MKLNNNSIIARIQSKKTPEGTSKSLSAGLTLTSLVDCFTILVVYLLVATSIGGEEMNVSKEIKLPEAMHSAELAGGPIARIENKNYYFDEEKVTLEQLSERFQIAARGSEAVIIQADKKNDYSVVNPVVLSALQAGFKKVKFAVLQTDEN